MMTGNEYKESLRKIHPRIYYMGEKIDCVVASPNDQASRKFCSHDI